MSVRDSSAESRFGGIVRTTRLARGMSQRALAALMNDRGQTAWVQSTVGKTEAGERPLRFNEVLALCEILGIDLAENVSQLALPESNLDRQLRENQEGLRVVQARIAEAEASLASLREVEQNLTKQRDELSAQQGEA